MNEQALCVEEEVQSSPNGAVFCFLIGSKVFATVYKVNDYQSHMVKFNLNNCWFVADDTLIKITKQNKKI